MGGRDVLCSEIYLSAYCLTSCSFCHVVYVLVKYKNVSSLLQIKDSRLHFRYNLNSLRTEEKDIWLSAITVGDGQWHTAKVRIFYVFYAINNSCVEWDRKLDLEVCCYGQFESIVLVTVTKNRARIWTHWTNPTATWQCLNYALIHFLTCPLKHARYS